MEDEHIWIDNLVDHLGAAKDLPVPGAFYGHNQYFGGHHIKEDFAVRGKEPKDEVQIYTWMYATLREMTYLVKEVAQAARKKDAKLSLAFVYPDKNGRFMVKGKEKNDLTQLVDTMVSYSITYKYSKPEPLQNVNKFLAVSDASELSLDPPIDNFVRFKDYQSEYVGLSLAMKQILVHEVDEKDRHTAAAAEEEEEEEEEEDYTTISVHVIRKSG